MIIKFNKTELQNLARSVHDIEEYLDDNKIIEVKLDDILNHNIPGQIYQLTTASASWFKKEMAGVNTETPQTIDKLIDFFIYQNDNISDLISQTYGIAGYQLEAVFYTQIYCNLLFFIGIYKPTLPAPLELNQHIITILNKYKLHGLLLLFTSITTALKRDRELVNKFHKVHDNLSQYIKQANLEDVAEATTFFYEEFLLYYSQPLREKLGIYQTPTPVVDFIQRSIPELATKVFNIDINNTPDCQVLDFATGTGTFLKVLLHNLRLDNLTYQSRADIINRFLFIASGIEFNTITYTLAIYNLEFLCERITGTPLSPSQHVNIINASTIDLYFLKFFLESHYHKFLDYIEARNNLVKNQREANTYTPPRKPDKEGATLF